MDAIKEVSTGEYISLRAGLEQLMMTSVENWAGRCTGPKGEKYSPHRGEKMKSKISWDTAAEGTKTLCVRPQNFPTQAHMVRVETDAGTLCGVIKLTTGASGHVVEAWASLWRHGLEFETSPPKFVNGKLLAKKQKTVKVKKSEPLPCKDRRITKTLARIDAGIRKALMRVAMSAGRECLHQWYEYSARGKA